MSTKRRNRLAVIFLFFLSPAIGELLSGSAPPAEFFNPFGLFIMAALYGSGALLIRELRIRWRKGWSAILVLGAAYGIVEEGLMVKSFFDPAWMDLGILGTYGRWAGVNWVWSLELTIYHAVFSITIPIFLAELVFQDLRQAPWLGKKGIIFFSCLLAADVMFGFFALTTYRPPFLPYLLSLILVLVLGRIASRLPAPVSPSETVEAILPRPRAFTLLGFGATLGLFFLSWVVPHLKIPALLTMAGLFGLVYLVYKIVQKLSRQWNWKDEHRLALAFGGLLFFMILAPLQELDQTRPDNTSGMAIVGLVTFVLLVLLWRKVRRISVHTPAYLSG